MSLYYSLFSSSTVKNFVSLSIIGFFLFLHFSVRLLSSWYQIKLNNFQSWQITSSSNSSLGKNVSFQMLWRRKMAECQCPSILESVTELTHFQKVYPLQRFKIHSSKRESLLLGWAMEHPRFGQKKFSKFNHIWTGYRFVKF